MKKKLELEDNEQKFLEKAKALFKNDKIDATIINYKKAQLNNPNSLLPYLSLGSILVNLKLEEEGFNYLKEAVNKFPKKVEPYIALGAAFTKIGGQKEAQKFLKKALEIDSQPPLWIYNQAGLDSNNIIFLHDYKIAYSSIPKCASTTLKNILYKIDNNINDETNITNPHRHFNNPAFKSNVINLKNYHDYFKFVIVRDPVKRFLSYFNKNIKNESLLKLKGFPERRYLFGLDRLPDLNFFINNLEDYKYVFIDVRHHTLCQTAYIGKSLEDYDCITPLENLTKLNLELNKFLGKEIEFPHLMKSEQPITELFSNISLKSLKQLIDYYSDDYQLLQDYYSPDDILREYKESKKA